MSCQIVKELINVEIPSGYSIIKHETYTSYDTCNPNIIHTWKDWSVNMPPFTIYVLILVVGILLLMWYDDRRNGRK